jgi:hypothetical protein
VAATPEGAVKKLVTSTLRGAQVRAQTTGGIWFFMPVQNGMGAAVLDYMGSHRGRAFAIETKAPGKLPTERQVKTINDMKEAGIHVFVIDGEKSCRELVRWLNGLID